MAADESPEPALPQEPIDRVVRPLERFLHVEAASGVVLLACALTALVLANSPAAEGFLAFWKTPVGLRLGAFELEHSLQHWINDGLTVIFFFVIGLEVKREIVLGELRELRKAALPLAAAVGGMVVPAGVYLALLGDDPARDGWGIPMATDIAFVVGCMAVLGRRIPLGLRALLLSLAIADDIGAILVIAIGYTDSIDTTALVLGLGGIAVVFGMQRVGVRSIGVYAVLGVAIWLAFHESGVHATIAGVIMGLMTPARAYLSASTVGGLVDRASDILQGGDWEDTAHRPEKVRKFARATRETLSPLEYLEGTLHPWVSFLIMPIFALANAGVPFELADLGQPVALAVGAGLVIGKPVGIVAVSFLAVKLGLASLPQGVNWRMMTGAGFLAGIGFTMALFIAGLALDGPALDVAKVGVLVASALAAVAGMVLLVLSPSIDGQPAGD
jgi:NhaA family Na+:H+ antiporter